MSHDNPCRLSFERNMAHIVDNSNRSQSTNPYLENKSTGVLEMSMGAEMSTGATGPITRTLSKRRSHRRQWRIFERIAMVILDAWLVSIAFQLSYEILHQLYTKNQDNFFKQLLSFIRINVLRNGPDGLGISGLTSFAKLGWLDAGIVVGLIAIFALRGLYRMRLTGTWFRQAWTIISSATIGSAFLVTYFF